MNTLTLFNAYTKARDGLHEVCTIIAGGDMPNDELARFMRMGARLERQSQTLAAAIRRHLTQRALIGQLADVQAALINEKNDAIAELNQRVADLEAALRDIIAENPNPKLPYGHRVNEIARTALAGTTSATANDYADDLVNDCEDGGAGVQP